MTLFWNNRKANIGGAFTLEIFNGLSFAAIEGWTLTISDFTVEFATAQINLLFSTFGIAQTIIDTIDIDLIIGGLPKVSLVFLS